MGRGSPKRGLEIFFRTPGGSFLAWRGEGKFKFFSGVGVGFSFLSELGKGGKIWPKRHREGYEDLKMKIWQHFLCLKNVGRRRGSGGGAAAWRRHLHTAYQPQRGLEISFLWLKGGGNFSNPPPLLKGGGYFLGPKGGGYFLGPKGGGQKSNPTKSAHLWLFPPINRNRQMCVWNTSSI